MILTTFSVGAFQCNCSIIADEKSGEAIVVDPGDEAERILGELQKSGLSVKYLVHTHAHIDHIMATATLHEKTRAAICLNKGDQFLYDNIAMQGDLLGLSVTDQVKPVTQYLEHGDDVICQDLRLKVLHTPGHTPGSICFLWPNVELGGQKQTILFSGDTLFSGSIGRTDLWGGDFDQIIDSIKSRLLTLDEHTQVIPGHGPTTLIAREAKSNPFLQG